MVDGVTYREWMDVSGSSIHEGQTLKIAYDPDDPSVVHSSDAMGIFMFGAGALLLIFLIAMGVKERMAGHAE